MVSVIWNYEETAVIWNYEETAKTTDTTAPKAFDNFRIEEFYSTNNMFLNVRMFPRYAITTPCKFAFENCPLKAAHLAISKPTRFFSSPLRPHRLWDPSTSPQPRTQRVPGDSFHGYKTAGTPSDEGVKLRFYYP